jgi:hypothetical protein
VVVRDLRGGVAARFEGRDRMVYDLRSALGPGVYAIRVISAAGTWSGKFVKL